MSYELPDLKFSYEALEPYIDSETMQIHHKGYHASYLKGFKSAISNTQLEEKSLHDIFNNISQYPDKVKNNAGGFYNHFLFWQFLSPERQKIEDVNLMDSINKYFGTFENMKKEFSQVAVSLFGSGWTWIIKRPDGELIIVSTPNQDNPLMDTAPIRGTPILCLDLWEHAYYLNYQDHRSEYVEAFWNIVNWDRVTVLFNR